MENEEQLSNDADQDINSTTNQGNLHSFMSEDGDKGGDFKFLPPERPTIPQRSDFFDEQNISSMSFL